MGFRWLYDTALDDASLFASSTDSAYPLAWIRDQIRSRAWRSAAGWTIVAGWNDRIDYTRSGAKVATITPGTYATGALLAAAVVAALEAADATPVWACSYSAGVFTISSDIAFTTQWLTGPNVARSIGLDLGFAAADGGSGTSHVGGTAVYQSRQYIAADFGAAKTATAAAVANCGRSTATVRISSSPTSVLAALVATPTTISGANTVGVAYFASTAARYWALVIDDRTNQAGYSECGVLMLGVYVEPARMFAPGYGRDREAIGNMSVADSGAHFHYHRATRRTWSMEFAYLATADRDALEALSDAVGVGGCFFVHLDSSDLATRLYAFFPSLPVIAHEPVSGAVAKWRASAQVADALD